MDASLCWFTIVGRFLGNADGRERFSSGNSRSRPFFLVIVCVVLHLRRTFTPFRAAWRRFVRRTCCAVFLPEQVGYLSHSEDCGPVGHGKLRLRPMWRFDFAASGSGSAVSTHKGRGAFGMPRGLSPLAPGRVAPLMGRRRQPCLLVRSVRGGSWLICGRVV